MREQVGNTLGLAFHRLVPWFTFGRDVAEGAALRISHLLAALAGASCTIGSPAAAQAVPKAAVERLTSFDRQLTSALKDAVETTRGTIQSSGASSVAFTCMEAVTGHGERAAHASASLLAMMQIRSLLQRPDSEPYVLQATAVYARTSLTMLEDTRSSLNTLQGVCASVPLAGLKGQPLINAIDGLTSTARPLVR